MEPGLESQGCQSISRSPELEPHGCRDKGGASPVLLSGRESLGFRKADSLWVFFFFGGGKTGRVTILE